MKKLLSNGAVVLVAMLVCLNGSPALAQLGGLPADTTPPVISGVGSTSVSSA